MPELPEVETTRRGIARHITGKPVVEVVVRERRLRKPITRGFAKAVTGQTFHQVERRGKYLLLRADHGTVIVHLGMSGSLRLAAAGQAPRKHDHLDLVFSQGRCLRLHDPRRFGMMLWARGDPLQHPLLRHLGPEPLDAAFTGDYLYARSRRRVASIKQLIMDSRVIAGIGNIYANEALFRAGIHPLRAAGRISRGRYLRLAEAIKQVLREAIRRGGTTLRDFVSGDGRPGYFRPQLRVYGRAGRPCRRCDAVIRRASIGQRATYYCPRCQR